MRVPFPEPEGPEMTISLEMAVLRCCGQSANMSSNSLRCRGVSPLTVLEELTRHRSRSLLAFTRPYLGAARTRSRTLAV
jgi:hypothetical protein